MQAVPISQDARVFLLNRREFARTSALSAGYWLGGLGRASAADPEPAGKLLQVLDFLHEGEAPLSQPIGDELDQRRYTDLSRISASRMVTPTGDFFVRSGASTILPAADKWTVSIDGLVEKPANIDIRALRARAKPMGLHLMECAGNVRITHFGLISVANWSGVTLDSLLGPAALRQGATQVLVSGFDQYAHPSQTSIPGADWIFPLDALNSAGAFLATGLNGEMLTRDHGAPVRLVVPGWYGCACIKWVQSITLVDDTVEATSQMREYAVRTLQSETPGLARDYEPATVDHAAIPIRVEKWRMGAKLRYRIIGILWGGAEPVSTLSIRFNPEEEFVPVQGFHQNTRAPWTVWEHMWSPSQPGTYAIQLAVSEPQVRARKMDGGYYVRFVEISQV